MHTGDAEHLVDLNDQEIELAAGDGIKKLVFFNDRKPGIHLVKVDSADPSRGIPNAVFEIRGVDADFGPKEFTTGPDGTIDLSALDPGAYVVTEKKCPGYVIDEAQRIIHLVPNQTAAFVFTNSKLPSLRLLKTSSDGLPLKGVSFRLAKIEDGSHYLDRTTSATGEILWEGLEPGVYSLVETATLNNHIISLKEHHVELFPGKVSEIVLENHKRPNLIVYKNDADSGEPIKDTVFVVKAADGHSVDEIKTGPDGKAELKNLLPGVYEISEKSVPSPWLKDAPAQLVTLYPDRDHTAYFKNHKRPVIEIIKENAVTFEPLANVPFRVWYASNHTNTGEFNDLGTFYTDEEGRIELNGPEMGELGLRDGWFRVQELEPLKGFAKADPDTQETFVPAGQSHTFRFRNNPLSAICVWKYDSQNPNMAIEGAVFQIRYLSGNTSGTGGTVIGTYQTSQNGSFTATGLKKGAYIIEELSSDGSHVIDTPPQTVYLSGEEQEVIQVYFGNSPKGSLLVKKVSASDGTPLSDVEFFVTASDGTVVGNANGKFVTGLDGTFMVDNIDPNTTLVVRETRAKPGYLLDDAPQTAQVKAGQTVTLEFRNQKKGNLVIHKLSGADKSTPLPGAQFKITRADGTAVDAEDGKLSSNGLYQTNAEGQIVLSGVVGTLICTEVSSAPGYAIDPNTRSQTVVIHPGDDARSLYFYNNPLCSLTVSKVDSTSGKPVPNTQFAVKYASGESVGTYTTGKDGTVTVSGLLPNSTVIVTETKVPDTHVLDTTPHVVTLKTGKNTITSGVTATGGNSGNDLTVENDPKMTLTIRKYIKGTNREPLAGVCFKVTEGSGAPVGSGDGAFYTNSAGEIVIEGLEPGITVTAREISTVDGFALDGEPKSVTIKAGSKAPELIFWNERVGTLVIQKKSTTGELLSGAEFLLTYADGRYVDAANGHLSSNGLYTTNKNGEIRVDVVGTVVVKEVKSPSGYVIDPATQTQTVTVRPSDQQTLVFLNEALCSLTISKVDSISGKPVPNTQFSVKYANGEPVGTYTTGKDGTVTVSGLLPDSAVIVTETKVPDTHVLDTMPHVVTLKAGKNTVTSGVTGGGTSTGSGNDLTVENAPKMTLTIRKYINGTDREPLAGVRFKVTEGSGAPVGSGDGIFYTNSAGEIVIEGLEPGITVTAREISTVDGFVLDGTPQTVEIKAGKTAPELVFWNRKAGELVIRKLDKITQKPLAGVEFELTYAEGGYVDNANGHLSNKGLYTTDEKGEIRVTGITGTIVAKETRTIPGYTIDPGTQSQTVTVNPADTQTITFYNTPGTTLTIQKYIDGTTDPLAGVTFLVTDSSGAVLGPDNGEFVTDENGRIVLENLVPGETITAKEVRTVDGFVLDGAPKSIKIKEGEGQQLTFTNKRAGTLVIEKLNSVTNAPLAGAQFQLTYTNGAYLDIDNGHLSGDGIYTTNNLGEIRISGLTGTVIAREVKAAPGYVIDNSSRSQTVTVKPNETKKVTFRNEPLCSLTLTKLDSVSGKPVPGTRFTVKDGNGNVIGQYTTGKDGTVTVTGLIPGAAYVVSETKVPSGYVLNTTPQTIIVKNGANTVSSGNTVVAGGSITGNGINSGNGLTFENDPKMTLTIRKYIEGTDNEPLSGVTFKVTDGSGAPVGGSDGIFRTDKTGSIVIEGLEPGMTVTAQEVKTVEGFVLDGSAT